MTAEDAQPWRSDPEWQAAYATYLDPAAGTPTEDCVARIRAAWLMHEIELRLTAEFNAA